MANTVSEISVTDFGTIKVTNLQSSGRVELSMQLNECALAFDLVQRAFQSVPGTAQKSISHNRVMFVFRIPKHIKKPHERRLHVVSLISDWLKSVERAACSPTIQTALFSNPLYLSDPRVTQR